MNQQTREIKFVSAYNFSVIMNKMCLKIKKGWII